MDPMGRFGREILVTDGAWGTSFQARGLPAGDPPDEWNLSHPDIVEEIAASYVAAGSDIILTNTFGANPFVLGRSGLAEKTREINRAGAEISRRAAGDRVLVFASIGPTGEFMEPLGLRTPEDLTDAFRRQVEGLLKGRPDGFVLETMTDPQEIRCAVSAVRELSGLPIVACLTFDSGEDHSRTMMGVSPEDAVAALEDLPIQAIGANCGVGPDVAVHLCRRFRQATDLPIWIKANAGMPHVVDGECVFDVGADEFAAHVPALAAAGARFIGGCCGTTPEHVRRIREQVDAL